MAFQGIKPVWKVGIVIYIVALVVYIVGFATPEWYTVNKIDLFGLFRVCGGSVCYDVDNLPTLNNGITKSTLWTPSQALTSTGLAALVIGGALVVTAAAIDKVVLSLPGVILIIIGGILGFAGGIFFMVKGTDLYDKVGSYGVGYSSILLLIGCIAEVVSAILLLAGRPSQSSVGP